MRKHNHCIDYINGRRRVFNLILVLLSNLYLGLGELVAKPCDLGLIMLIKLVNGLLPFFNGFGIYDNMAPILAYKGIERFLYSGLEGRGLYIVDL